MRPVIGAKEKILFIAFLCHALSGANSESDDGGLSNLGKLRGDILKDYDISARPVLHHKNTTNLAMTLKPFYISELDEARNILVMDAWAILTWNDDHLTWEPSDYQGLTYLPLGPTDIWKPDITVFSSCPSSDIDPFGKTNMVVSSDGTVTWTPPATIRNVCLLDYTNYPWDTQTCIIVFGSWSQHGLEINLTTAQKEMNLEDFRNTNPFWKLQDTRVLRVVNYYNCCPDEPYMHLEYNVTLSRRPTIGQQLEWISSIGIVILTLSVFWLPPNSEAKLTIGSINILTTTGLLLYLESHVKSVATLAYIGKLMNFSLYAVASAMILEILVMNMASTFGPCGPPGMLYDVISGITGRILLLDATKSSTDDPEDRPSVRKQWLAVATMMDRLLFCIFLIALLAIPKTG